VSGSAKNKVKPNYPIKVLEKAFSILDLMLEKGTPLSILEISRELGMSLSTVHRILDTLRFWGYVEQSALTQNYSLGFKLVELGMAKLRQVDWLKESAPLVKKLRDLTQETVHLSVLAEGEVLCLMKEESSRTIKMSSYVGKRGPLHCTASGKVLLAHLNEEERQRIIQEKGLTRFTSFTITTEQELEKELAEVRMRGFAVDRGEHEEEVNCISAPIRDHSGEVIAALSVSGPSFRIRAFDPDPSLIQAVLSTAQAISERLGYKTPEKERRKAL